MFQISTQTILREYKILSSAEKTAFANAYFSTQNDISTIIQSIIDAIGERIFKTASELTDIPSALMERSNAVLLMFAEFSRDLNALSLDVQTSMIGAELMSRNAARQLGLTREQTNKEFPHMRSKLRENLNEHQKKIQKLSQNLSGHFTDLSSNLDPLDRKREYVFYDAYAIIRGPRPLIIVDFNNDIMSAQTSLTTEINPGTFSITYASPNEQYVDDYGYYDFYTGGMIEIWATDRFQDPGKENTYRRIFWGIIEKVQDGYADGVSKITISGQDVTAWFNYTTIRPAPTKGGILSENLNVNEFSHKYAGISILQIIADLIFNDLGDFSRFARYSVSDLISSADDKTQASDTQTDKSLNKEDVIEYWKQLFINQLRVKVFGYGKIVATGQARLPNEIDASKIPPKGTTSETQTTDETGNKDDVITLGASFEDQCDARKILDNYIPIRIFADPAVIDNFQSEDMPKIEVIRRILEGTMFEFFMDIDGSLIFKPPFYNEYPANNDTKRYDEIGQTGCGASTLQQADEIARAGFDKANEYIIEAFDVISFDLSEDSSVLVTRQQVTGEPKEYTMQGGIFNGGAQNNDLVKRYGLRYGSPKKLRMMTSAEDLNVAASAFMDYQNIKYLAGTITIIGRPELHLGRTIYFVPRNTIYYITGISHNFTEGSTFTTTLTVIAGRRMFLDAQGNPLENIFDGEQFENKDTDDPAQDLPTLLKQLDATTKALETATNSASTTSAQKQTLENQQASQQAQADKLKTKQNKPILDKIRKNGNISLEQIKALGQLPRRITDSYGRRMFGMLGYGLAATPPKQNTTDPTSTAATPVSSGQSGPPSSQQFKNNLPTTANKNQTTVGNANNPTADPRTQEEKYTDSKSSGAGQTIPSTKTILERTTNCSTSPNNKAFNPSSIVSRRIVNGTNL